MSIDDTSTQVIAPVSPGKPPKKWHQRWSIRIPALALAALIGIIAASGGGSTPAPAAKTAPASSTAALAIQRLQIDHIPGPYQTVSTKAFYDGDQVISAAQGTSPTTIGAGPPGTMPGTSDGPMTEMVIVSATPAKAALLASQLASEGAPESAQVNTPWQVTQPGTGEATSTLVIIGGPEQMAEFDRLVLSIPPS